MISAQPGEVFTALLTGAPQGLEGELSFTVTLHPAGTVTIAESAAAIVETEQPDDTSAYVATRTMPEDADPTVLGSIEYEAAWEADGFVGATEEVVVTSAAAVLPSDTRPTTAEVAALLRTRTKTPAGAYGEDFTATTKPSAAHVETLITIASGLILPGLGDLSESALECTDSSGVLSGARSLVTLGAAMFVEASFWPEQQGQGEQDVSALMRDLIEGDSFDRVAKAAARCRGETGGGDEEGGGGGSADVSYAFPEDRGGMLGHGSRWRRLASIAERVGWDEADGVYTRRR